MEGAYEELPASRRGATASPASENTYRITHYSYLPKRVQRSDTHVPSLEVVAPSDFYLWPLALPLLPILKRRAGALTRSTRASSSDLLLNGLGTSTNFCPSLLLSYHCYHFTQSIICFTDNNNDIDAFGPSLRPLSATLLSANLFGAQILPCGWRLASTPRPALRSDYLSTHRHRPLSDTLIFRAYSYRSASILLSIVNDNGLRHRRRRSYSSMPSYGSLHSPSLKKHNIMDQRRGPRFSFGHIIGDPFALATLSISLVREDCSLPSIEHTLTVRSLRG